MAFRIVLAEQTINSPTDAVKAFNKYNGSDIEIGINGKLVPITFLRSSATGENNNDELKIELLWDFEDPVEFEKIYKNLRSSINNSMKMSIGRDEFFGVLMDTTKVPAGVEADDAVKHKFEIVFSQIKSTVNREAQVIEAKKHETSIVEVLVPEGIWSHICQYVPGAKDLEDPPHITLCYIPKMNKEQLALVQALLTEVTSTAAPFQINITGSGCFEGKNGKVPHYARIESLDLAKIRDKITEAINLIDPTLVDDETFPNFCPHVTVQYVKGDEPLPVIKPISWVCRELSLSCKGTEKYLYPLSLVNSMQGEPSICPGTEVTGGTGGIITTGSLEALADKIITRLICAGFIAEAEKFENITSEVIGKKKKKKKDKDLRSDKSIDKFVEKLKKELGGYVHKDHLERATGGILRLLMDDNGTQVIVDNPADNIDMGEIPGDLEGWDMGDGGDGGDGGGGGGVEGMGPNDTLSDTDKYTKEKVKAPQTFSNPSGAPMGDKAIPFMERNYSFKDKLEAYIGLIGK